MRPAAWPRWLAFGLLSGLLLGAVWSVPYLPTTDGPEWVLSTHAENRYADVAAPYAGAFVPTLQFASRGFAFVYGPLEAWLGWQRGLSVALGFIVLASAWGFVAFVRAVSPDRWALGALGFPLALGWCFYMGFWPFVVSSAIGLFVLAAALDRPAGAADASVARRGILAALLLVQAVAHVFGAVITGAALLIVELARAPRTRRRATLAATLATGLPAALVFAASITVSLRDPHRLGGHVAWRDAILVLPQTIAPGPLGRAWLVTLGVVAAGVLAAIRVARARGEGEPRDATDRAVGLAGVLLLLAGAAAPCQIPGWQFVSQRFVPLGVALVIVAIPIERVRPAPARLTPWVLFGVSAAWLASSYPFHRRLAALTADALATLPVTAMKARAGGNVLGVTLAATEDPVHDYFRAEVPFASPLEHIASLYATALDGVPATSFAGRPAIHAFARRPSTLPAPNDRLLTRTRSLPAFRTDARLRRTVEDDFAAVGMAYDEVVVVAAMRSDFAVWEARGYVTDARSDKTLVAHFEPCMIDVVITDASGVGSTPRFDVRIGSRKVRDGVEIAAARTDVAQAETRFRIAPAPCGAIAVRPWWASPRGVLLCRNAASSGELEVVVQREAAEVRCVGPERE